MVYKISFVHHKSKLFVFKKILDVISWIIKLVAANMFAWNQIQSLNFS